MSWPSDISVNNSYAVEGMEGEPYLLAHFWQLVQVFFFELSLRHQIAYFHDALWETAATSVSENVASGNITFKSNTNNECDFKLIDKAICVFILYRE